jgi:hypothetical protein
MSKERFFYQTGTNSICMYMYVYVYICICMYMYVVNNLFYIDFNIKTYTSNINTPQPKISKVIKNGII